MTKFNDLDDVRVTRDYPDCGIKAGDTGTIIFVFTYPDEAYEVEFSNGKGGVRATITAQPEDLEKAE